MLGKSHNLRQLLLAVFGKSRITETDMSSYAQQANESGLLYNLYSTYQFYSDEGKPKA